MNFVLTDFTSVKLTYKFHLHKLPIKHTKFATFFFWPTSKFSNLFFISGILKKSKTVKESIILPNNGPDEGIYYKLKTEFCLACILR